MGSLEEGLLKLAVHHRLVGCLLNKVIQRYFSGINGAGELILPRECEDESSSNETGNRRRVLDNHPSQEESQECSSLPSQESQECSSFPNQECSRFPSQEEQECSSFSSQ